MCIVTITKIDGEVIKEPFGEEDRCSNCGKPISQAKEVISGGMITDGEWGCCKECANDLEDKNCCFEELGQYVYRKQTY